MHEIVFYIKPLRVPTLSLECMGEETHTVLDPVTSAVSASQHSVLEKGNVVCPCSATIGLVPFVCEVIMGSHARAI